MFNIGTPELALIFVAALLLLGPQKLPEFARWVGQTIREIQKYTYEVRNAINLELEREEFEKLKQEFEDLDPSKYLDPNVSLDHHEEFDQEHHDQIHEGMFEHDDLHPYEEIVPGNDGTTADGTTPDSAAGAADQGTLAADGASPPPGADLPDDISPKAAGFQEGHQYDSALPSITPPEGAIGRTPSTPSLPSEPASSSGESLTSNAPAQENAEKDTPST